MNKEIQEIIEKNLPQQVGETLKKVLEQGQKDAKELEEAKKQLVFYQDQETELRKTIKEYQKFDDRNTQLDSREKELNKKAHNLQIEELKYQLQSEKEKTEFSKNVALGLVRNIEYRRTLHDNVVEPGYEDKYGNWQYPNKTQDSEETKTAE